MISIKPGVNLKGISPEIVIALQVAESIYAKHDIEGGLVVTSALDSKHKRGSKHYIGNAVDIRTRTVPNDDLKLLISEEIAAALGNEYDVVLESTHIHIEFDPPVGINV